MTLQMVGVQTVTRAPGVWGVLLAGVWLSAITPAVRAHPVPKGSHDRTATIRLTAEAVVVEYRLEVDPWTVIFEDLAGLEDKADLSKLSKPHEFYQTFTRLYGPVLAAGLDASLDGGRLSFECVRHGHEVLDHLRCDFVFRAAWRPRPGATHRLAFRDANFKDRPGEVRLAVVAGSGVGPLRPGRPDGEGLSPEERGRRAEATFELAADGQGAAPVADGGAGGAEQERPRGAEDSGLLRLFLDSRHGPLLLLLLAAALGAAHALTPGHGKTLVAAYLVGERGTAGHAFVLGLATTLTHTGVVLVLALVLWLAFPHGISADERGGIQRALELGGGLLIAGLGFWLLMRRLSGQADHVHLGGSGHHHHHHHHHPHDHHHDHTPPHPAGGGWGGLIVLGVSGGIVPCWDAVALLVAAVAMDMLWWALPMLLAFSAGLAAVLIAIGVLVVRTKSLAGKRWENSRVFRALPLVSAVLVTALGLWLCYRAVQGV